jgi:hypothetical protein
MLFRCLVCKLRLGVQQVAVGAARELSFVPGIETLHMSQDSAFAVGRRGRSSRSTYDIYECRPALHGLV